MTLDIKTLKDIQRVQEAILNNEEFVLGKIEPINFKLKLDGGRFKDYNPKFIDKFVAKTILSQQANYEKTLKEIEKQYNVKISDEAKLLKFKLEKGSLDLLTDLLGLMEVFKEMQSIHQLYAVLGIAGGWFSYMGFSKYLDTQIKKTEIALNEAKDTTHKEVLLKTVEAIKEVSTNVMIQKSINNPKQEILKMLKDDEVLTINDDIQHKITNDDVNEFDVTLPVVEDIEEEIEDTYSISTYYFKSKEKYFKLNGLTVNANSITMPAKKRMKIITKAEAQQPVKLKLKIIKDGITKKVKSVYIIDYIEN